MLKIRYEKYYLKRKSSSSFIQLIVQQHVGATLGHSAKSDAQFSEPAPSGKEKMEEKEKKRPRDYANRKSLRTGEPENSGFSSIQL